MRSAQVSLKSERSPGLPRVLESTSSGCSSGASPGQDTSAKRLAPSPPALPSAASGTQIQQSLAYITRLGASVGDHQLLMAAQQLQQQQLQFSQANVQRFSDNRLEVSYAGATMGGPSLAACKQSSSSSFNGSPITNASAALEPREEPMLPSTRASDTGMAANRVLRLLQQQGQQQGQRQERCPTPPQHHLPPHAPSSSHQCDEEVASQQQGRILPPLRLDTAGEAAAGAAIAQDGDTGCNPGPDAATAPGQDGLNGRISSVSHGLRTICPDDTAAAGSNCEQLMRRASQDAPGLINGASTLTTKRPPQLHQQQLQVHQQQLQVQQQQLQVQQQQQQLAAMQASQRISPGSANAGASADVGAGAASAAMGSLASQAQQLRQLQIQQQHQIQMRHGLHLQQQQQQHQAEMQSQQRQLNPGQQQQQLASCGSMASPLLGGQDRIGAAAAAAAAAGLEAQVRARLGLPPKRLNNQGPLAGGASGGHGAGLGAAAVGGPSGLSAASGQGLSESRLGLEGGPLGAARQHARMRFLAAAATASGQTSLPSMSCTPAQAAAAPAPQLHTSGPAPSNGMSGLPRPLGGTGQSSEQQQQQQLLLGSSPAIFPASSHLQQQQQQRRQQQELMLSQQQQQQRLSVRQALLRGGAAASAAVTQAGGPFAAAAAAAAALSGGIPSSHTQLERASSAPQAALETQIAAARLRKLEQMGISPSQAVLAAAAGGRFSGLQPQLGCRTSVGYAGAGNSPSEAGSSPMSGRSFKRSAAERCWEEQQHQLLLQQQQQFQPPPQQQQLQMQGMAGLASPEGGATRFQASGGGGLGVGVGPAGGALQAMKRSRAYGAAEMFSAPAGRSFASQPMQRFDVPAAAQSQQQEQQQHQQQAAMMCRSMPEDIHSMAMLSVPVSGGGGGSGFPGAGVCSLTGMAAMPGGVTAMQMPPPQQPHMGLGGHGGGRPAAGPGPGQPGMGLLGSGLGPMDHMGPGGGMLAGGGGMGLCGGMSGMAMGGMDVGIGAAMGVGMSLPPGSGDGMGMDGGGAAQAPGGGGDRPSAGCAGGGGADGLGPTPALLPRCSDAAMDLAGELGAEQDYMLADAELQSFIAELCAPGPAQGAGSQQEPLTGSGVGAVGAPGSGGQGGQDVAMTEGGGAGGGEGRADAARGPGSAGAGGVGGPGGPGQRPPQGAALDEEQRALQTEAEALLNFKFD